MGTVRARIPDRTTIKMEPLGIRDAALFCTASAVMWSIDEPISADFMSLGETQAISPPQYEEFDESGVPPPRNWTSSPRLLSPHDAFTAAPECVRGSQRSPHPASPSPR